jgi:RNA polymerase sigma-70 factor, ECF subfamily
MTSLFVYHAMSGDRRTATMPTREALTVDERRASGDEVMAAAYEEAWRPVFRYAFMMLGNREDAEDICGEAFVRAHQAWRKGRGPTGRALPWMLVIARRLILDRQRRRRLIAWLPLAEHDVTDDAGMAELARSEMWMWFSQLAQLLPGRQREAVLLRYQFDLPDADIARTLGLSEAGVRTLVSRAMKTLRSHPELLQ